MKTKNVQPKFETFKVWLFNVLNSNPEKTNSLFISMINDPKQYHEKEKEFREELNKWLDTIDIRCVSTIVEKVKQNGVKIPKKYQLISINYNKYDNLDLV